VRIRKWYLDCVAGDGTTWIGYWGCVQFAMLRVTFASSFLSDGSPPKTLWSAAVPPPLFSNDRVSWSALGANAELLARVPSAERELHPGVLWRCVVPSADATVHFEDRTLRGRGYAEVLELSVAPWKLPIRELRWGRALSEETSLVWIEWTGAQPLRVALRNGVFETPAHVDDRGVRLDDGTDLTLSAPAVLREESLDVTLKPLRWLIPRRWRGSVERKWRSRGTLRAAGRPIEEGWVIHELVSFPAH